MQYKHEKAVAMQGINFDNSWVSLANKKKQFKQGALNMVSLA